MIRLLKYSADDEEIRLVDFPDDHDMSKLPRYAVLSHTWNADQEVTFAEFNSGAGKIKSGFDKIRFCVERAAADGIEYSWVDTCCIDKSTIDELSAAINSMFRWYQGAAKCYVFLSDVSVPAEVSEPAAYKVTWMNAFQNSRWFTRGWTLQELLAPGIVEFYSRERRLLGTKISLEHEICNITKLPTAALRQLCLSEFSVEERLGWTTGRATTKPEDRAYCLFGIFGVFMSLIYGEGEQHALRRLRQAIERARSPERLSVRDDAPTARDPANKPAQNSWNNDSNSKVMNQIGQQTIHGGQHQTF